MVVPQVLERCWIGRAVTDDGDDTLTTLDMLSNAFTVGCHPVKLVSGLVMSSGTLQIGLRIDLCLQLRPLSSTPSTVKLPITTTSSEQLYSPVVPPFIHFGIPHTAAASRTKDIL